MEHKMKRHSSTADDGYRDRILAKIGIYETPADAAAKPRKVMLTTLALQLLERKECEIRATQELTKPVKPATVWHHQFPQRKTRRIGESTGRADFDRIERDYHGAVKRQETGNLSHDLTTLIKSRS